MQKQREKGLCFSCNERFTPGYRCAIKQLFVFDAGNGGPQTMRVAGRIGSQRVLVLIDSGSTHNFIDQRLARHLGLSVTPIDKFWVTVASGEKLSCREKHEEVKLVIQGLDMAVTFFSLPLNGLDAVLGIQWLEKLGPVTCD
ncbi:hypothetical protein Patl1_35324 [Pistacia atlantica]|nr:hypothetical protein Patl1_35324 [Pistacia atlantica]